MSERTPVAWIATAGLSLMLLGGVAEIGSAYQISGMAILLDLPGTCTLSTTSANLGSSTGSAVDGTATLTVACTLGVNYTMTLNAGNNFDGHRRTLSAGAGVEIPYILTQDAAGTMEWGDFDGAGTYPPGFGLIASGTGAAQAHSVYVFVENFSGLAAPAATYSDTVLATIDF